MVLNCICHIKASVDHCNFEGKSIMPKSQRKCFIVAPSASDLSTIKSVLLDLGVTLVAPSDLVSGTRWATYLEKSIQSADFVLAVLDSPEASGNVLYEIGFARGLGRHVLVIAPNSNSIPLDLQSLLVIRAALDNRDAIYFALEQLVTALDRPKSSYESEAINSTTPLCERADEFSNKLNSLGNSEPRELEVLVYDLLLACGLTINKNIRHDNSEIDFAIWSDALATYVGNPLVVELKSSIVDRRTIESAYSQLTRYLNVTNAGWGILLYKTGPKHVENFKPYVANIIPIQLEWLISELRTTSFENIIRDLRNNRVHGTSL
jgi:hypothetical protein